MEKINKLIVYLMAISNYSKDIHYNAKGEAFYSKHLLSDRIQENINGYIDSIKELFFLSTDEMPLSSSEYLKQASEMIPPIEKYDKDSFINLFNLIIEALKLIEEIEANKAEENLLGEIAQNLQISIGLINRQIK